jgi:hypothetical protein
MKPKSLIFAAGITAALSCSAFSQQDEKLGKLSFPTSCDPKVQAEFERGVAMIHSYWFLIARRTFFRADRAVAVLGLEHFADMNAAAGRDRPHWDAALASINFAAHALASS